MCGCTVYTYPIITWRMAFASYFVATSHTRSLTLRRCQHISSHIFFFFFLHFLQKRFVCLLCLLSNLILLEQTREMKSEKKKKNGKTSMRLAKRTNTYSAQAFCLLTFSRVEPKIQWFRSAKKKNVCDYYVSIHLWTNLKSISVLPVQLWTNP